MAYYTELMQEILRSQAAQRMVQEITPRYGEAYAFLWLLQAMGGEIDKVVGFAEELEDQTRPQTATWALKYWETEYGIPPDETRSIKARRETILQRTRGSGAMNPERIRQIAAAAAGVDAKVIENISKNTFAVIFEMSHNGAEEKAAIEALDKAKPARLIYQLKQEGNIDMNLYTGAAFFNAIKQSFTTDSWNTDNLNLLADEDGKVLLEESESKVFYEEVTT